MFKKRKRRTERGNVLRQAIAEESDLVETEAKSVAIRQGPKQPSKAAAFEVSTNLQINKSKEVDTLHAYESTRSAEPAKYSGGATATLEIDTAPDRDARAIQERNIELNEETRDGSEEKVYRGQAAYTNYIKKTKETISKNKVTGTKGPLRAPTNIRSTSRFDYQPDICKDYKDTGYCGYGDSCKFLHDRSNYKAGWEIEKEWNAEQKLKKQRAERGEVPESQENKAPDEQKPFACYLCRKAFTKPVVTQCKHYFCQKCALEYYATSSKCAICRKPTKGIFNSATLD